MPLRTCVGCGETKEKDELIRLVCHEGKAVVDYKARLPGRGAYVCPERSCIERAMKRGRLKKAFKKDVDASALLQDIEKALNERILSLLGIAAGAGKIASGWNEVKAKRNKLKLILLSEDASQNTVRRFGSSAETYRAFSMVELGKVIGKGPRSVVGVMDEKLASWLRKDIIRYQRVKGE